MNMLLKQCEDLHKLAADADIEKDTRHFRDPLLEAANTIMVLHDELHAENAKLRELVSGLEYCVREPVCDCCCPLYDPSGANHRRCESLERELGIEVK